MENLIWFGVASGDKPGVLLCTLVREIAKMLELKVVECRAKPSLQMKS